MRNSKWTGNKYSNLNISYQCPQDSGQTQEVQNNQVVRMTHPMEPSQPLSLAIPVRDPQQAREQSSRGGRDERNSAGAPTHQTDLMATARCLANLPQRLKLSPKYICYYPSRRPTSYLVANWFHQTPSTLEGAEIHLYWDWQRFIPTETDSKNRFSFSAGSALASNTIQRLIEWCVIMKFHITLPVNVTI